MGETNKQRRNRSEKASAKYVRHAIDLKGMLAYARAREIVSEYGEYAHPDPLKQSLSEHGKLWEQSTSSSGQSRGGVVFSDGSIIACVVIPAWDYSEMTPGDDAQVEFFLLTPREGQNGNEAE